MGALRPGGEPLLTPAEIAEWWGTDVRTAVRRADAAGLRVTRTPGGHRRFFENEVSAFMRGQKETT